MAHTSTVTLLGGSHTSNGSAKLSKIHLDDTEGLRSRDSAKMNEAMITDENNNVSKVVEHEPNLKSGETGEQKGAYRMWGFFRVDQPVKTLNSIMIPLSHMLALYALFNVPRDVKILTALWGESQ